MDLTLVKLERVTVGHGRRAVLSGIDLRIERGGFTGLLGANGSGKTTLLRTILGVQPPLSGRVEWMPINGRKPVLGFVPQRESLDPAFLVSCLDVVLMGTCGRRGPGRLYGRVEKEWARECLAEADAGALAGRRFAELSGGQKQRVLIARALATRPDFLLLDEPTTGLDAAATRVVLELLRRVLERRGVSILMVNHDLAAMRAYVHDVIWIHDGRLMRGAVTELLRRETVESLLGPAIH